MFKIVPVLAAAAMLSACSAADAPDAAEAAGKFVSAVAHHDGAAACVLLSPRARDGLGPVGCGAGSPVARLPQAGVGSTVVWGDEAQARSAADTLFLHDFPDGWRITGAGCHPRNEQVYDCAVGGR
ncbi:hypothetical protein [Amycolatopsis lexingtonensis]|uniref:hypothetical protein n=1 Tax=Amycolatopsis lexingtonensis TaxID=218822 RepID=UPI003F6FF11A